MQKPLSKHKLSTTVGLHTSKKSSHQIKDILANNLMALIANIVYSNQELDNFSNDSISLTLVMIYVAILL